MTAARPIKQPVSLFQSEATIESHQGIRGHRSFDPGLISDHWLFLLNFDPPHSEIDERATILQNVYVILTFCLPGWVLFLSLSDGNMTIFGCKDI